MPYEFNFRVDHANHVFRCSIPTVRCQALKKNGGLCQRSTAIGTQFCYSHLLSEKNLRIKHSNTPNAGKGLFAQKNRSLEDNSVVFKKGAIIIDYTGELIDEVTLQSRYDEYTAPYAFELKRDKSYIDSACNRGIASLINHKPVSRANAKFVKTRTNGAASGIKVVATKNIKKNQEISASYGSTYKMRERTTHRTTYRRNPR
jgi:hypothetical protein